MLTRICHFRSYLRLDGDFPVPIGAAVEKKTSDSFFTTVTEIDELIADIEEL